MECIKVSFIGDIMCEKSFLNAARARGVYGFKKAFSGLTEFFGKSDYVIGNLETVCAGEEKRYTHELYSFNTPDSFVSALHLCGIDFVSTANNHCLDRGVDGMKRTLDVLDANNIGHTGTYRTKDEAARPCIIDVNGLKIGLVAFTYGTNPNMNGVVLSENELYYVDLLQKQTYSKDTSIKGKLKGLATVETKTKIKKALGKPYKNITVDDMPNGFDPQYLSKLSEAIRRIKEQSDYSICLLHCGGQFNNQPGAYSEYMMNFLQEQGVDSIIGNHPHNVQKSELKDNGIVTYCLGNVSISPSSIYVPMENLPDYSIMVHMYFKKHDKKLQKITASVLKIVEENNGYLNVLPVTEIYRTNQDQKLLDDTRKILECFSQKKYEDFSMQEEWDLKL